MLNCKPGDIAIINKYLRPNSPNAGKIVRCLRMFEVPPEGLLLPGYFAGTKVRPQLLSGLWWELDTVLPLFREGVPSHITHQPYVRDRSLTPIRDNDSDDETLTWAGKPEHQFGDIARSVLPPHLIRLISKE